MLSSTIQTAGYANEKLNTSLTKVSIWTDKGIDPVDIVDSVSRIALDVGEGLGTNVGVGMVIAKGVAVAFGVGGLAVGLLNGVGIAVGANVGETMVDVSDGSLQAEMRASTIKMIGMTFVFRSTCCSLHVSLDAF